MTARPAPGESSSADSDPVASQQSRWSGWWQGRSSLGGLFALVAFLVSFTPSLLPRDWVFQGLAAGLSAATAYALGVLIAFLLRPLITLLGIRIVIEPRRRRLVAVLTALVVLVIVAWVIYRQRQARVLTAELVQLQPPSVLDDLRALVFGIVLALAIIAVIVVVRLALAGSRLVLRLALPGWMVRVAAVVVVAALVGYASSEYVLPRTLEAVSATALELNNSTPDVGQPTSPLRSGGPGSTQPWSELGFQGQKFTGAGPTGADIEAVTGEEAEDPIRVYGSLGDDLTLEEVADNVVRELERTGAFERSTLTLIGTTGRGWVDEYNVASIEYLTGGDSATAAMQYSYLPSPVAFLTSRTAPAEAGQLLFDKVHAAVQALPADERPRLYVSGESLGAFGGTAAFADADEMLAKVDGAVWIGTPSFTPLWGSITAERLRGSPQVSPVYDQGRNIRFVTGPAGLDSDAFGREYGAWQEPRVAFLQYASDPIVWWAPELAFDEPDWIREGAGEDVNRGLRWWPLVSFWQVTLDMAVANDPPSGHGHIYEDDLLPVWDAVLNDERGSGEDLERITAALRASSADSGEG